MGGVSTEALMSQSSSSNQEDCMSAAIHGLQLASLSENPNQKSSYHLQDLNTAEHLRQKDLDAFGTQSHASIHMQAQLEVSRPQSLSFSGLCSFLYFQISTPPLLLHQGQYSKALVPDMISLTVYHRKEKSDWSQITRLTLIKVLLALEL